MKSYMKFKFLILFVFVLTTTHVTAAAPNSATDHAKIAQKDRTELFKRALAYLPSIMFSVMGKFKMSQDEMYMFVHIANIASLNLNISDKNEYVLPDKYKLFVVKESSDQRNFNLEPGETTRTASTTPYIHDPILINTLIVNDPAVEITLPDVVQLLIHEIGRKVDFKGKSDSVRIAAMQAADRYAAKVANAIKQDYQVIDLGVDEKLHILNSPIRYEPPVLTPTDKDYESQVNNFKSHQLRMGREILLFHENSAGFSYVPSLKPALLDGLNSIKVIPREQKSTISTSTINIQEVRVDRGISERPIIRFITNVFERAYRVSNGSEKDKDGKDKPTGEVFVNSFSSFRNDLGMATEGDEVLKSQAEIMIIFNKDGTVEISRREVLPSVSAISIEALHWQDKGAQRTGTFNIKIPKEFNANLLTKDLRAYMWARAVTGLTRVEVTKMIPEDGVLKCEFILPSALGTTQSYAVEEVILQNQRFEIVVDLPETLIVQKPDLKSHEFSIKKLERKNGDNWEPLQLKERSDTDTEPNQSLDKLDQIAGLVKSKPGSQRLRMLFKSDALLHELHFYMRGMYLTHDPMTKNALKGYLEIPEPFQKLFGKAVPGMKFQSASHFQMIDKSIHLPASQLKQSLKDGYVWVEFDLPMEVMPDKGLNSYDTGIRYTGKIIASNQRMEQLELDDLRHPIFGVEGTSWGADSCAAHFK